VKLLEAQLVIGTWKMVNQNLFGTCLTRNGGLITLILFDDLFLFGIL